MRRKRLLGVLFVVLLVVAILMIATRVLLPNPIKTGELVARWHCDNSGSSDRFYLSHESSRLAAEFECLNGEVNRLRESDRPSCSEVTLLIEYRARHSLDGAVVRLHYYAMPSCEAFARANQQQLHNSDLGWDDLLLLRRAEGWRIGHRVGGVIY